MKTRIKQRIKLTLALSLLLSAVGASGQSSAGGAGVPSDMNNVLTTPYEDLRWQPIVPELGNDSPQMAILHVDPRTGATQLIIRCSKSMHIPIHWHSANETHMIVKGSAVFEHDGKRMHMGPGSFNFMPAKMPHEAWTSEESVVFITVDGPWDVNWVVNPPGKADLGQKPPSF